MQKIKIYPIQDGLIIVDSLTIQLILYMDIMMDGEEKNDEQDINNK